MCHVRIVNAIGVHDMKNSIADLFKRPPDDEERRPSPRVVWNPGEWLLLHLSHQDASQLLVFLNADETQAAIDKCKHPV